MLDIRQEIVRTLAQAVRRGGHSLGSVPGLLRRVIEENMWQERQIGEGETITLAEFRQFIETEYPEGLGTTIETLEALCQHEPDIMDYLAQAKRGKNGAPLGNKNAAKYTVDERGNLRDKTSHDNIMSSSVRATQGTSAEYAYNKLRDEAFNADGTIKNPQVAAIQQRVVRGEISPHAGMIEAGFRVRKIAVNLNNPQSAAKTLIYNMDRDALLELVQLLDEHLADDGGAS